MKLKKIDKNFVAIIIIISLMLSFSATAFAESAANSIPEIEVETEIIMELGDTRIEYYEADNGDQVFIQYVNDDLDQINTIPADLSDIIVQEFDDFDNSISTHTIKLNDYIIKANMDETGVLAAITEVSPRATTVNKGTINFRAIVSTGYTYYGLKCSYSYSSGNSTYTIKSFAGKLVDLVSLVVSAISLPSSIASTALKKYAYLLGVQLLEVH